MTAFASGDTDETDLFLIDPTALLAEGGIDLETSPMVSAATLPEGSSHGSRAVSDVDLDGDGIDDLVVGADTFEGAGGGWDGRVYVHLGAGLRTAPRRAAEDADAVLVGKAGSVFGRGLSGWDDVDGDGLDDLVVGAPYWEDTAAGGYHAGEAYLFTGATLTSRASLTTADARTAIQLPDGAAGSAQLGVEIALRGDVTGDGAAELAVAGSWGGPDGSGAVWFFDPTDLPTGTTTTDDALHVVTAPRPVYELGAWVSGGFDFDGDGLADGFVNHRSEDGVQHYVSGALLTPGGTTTIGSDPGVVSWVDPAGVNITHAEADAGDFDGDGELELVLAAGSAPTESGRTGALYIVHARP